MSPAVTRLLFALFLCLAITPAGISADSNDDRIRALIAEAIHYSTPAVRRYDLALVRCQEADRLAATSGDLKLRAAARFQLARTYFNSERPAEAIEIGRDAAELARSAGALDMVANVSRIIGGSLLTLGRFEEAESALKEAAELSATFGSQEETAGAFNNLVQFAAPFNVGKALADGGAEAEAAFTEAVRLFEAAQSDFRLPAALVDRARARGAAGDGGAVERDLDRAIDLGLRQNHLLSLVLAFVERGHRRLAAGRLDESGADFEAAGHATAGSGVGCDPGRRALDGCRLWSPGPPAVRGVARPRRARPLGALAGAARSRLSAVRPAAAR